MQVAEAKVTSQQIDEARELYRPAAARASLLYFILNDLHKINPIYQFSLKVRLFLVRVSIMKILIRKKQCHHILFICFITYIYFQAFRVVFHKAIERSEANEDVKLRVSALIDTITYSVFLYTTRGLFEKDKLIFAAQMTFQVSGCGNYPPYH